MEHFDVKTSLAWSATLRKTSLARLTTGLYKILIPIEGIWSYFQSRGTGVPTQNFKMFKKQGGTPHIPIEDILSDFDIMVETLQKILRYCRSRGDTEHSH